MARGPCTFRESDVVRLVRAALKAGCKVCRVETDKTGKIVVVTDDGPAIVPAIGEGDDQWDQALK